MTQPKLTLFGPPRLELNNQLVDLSLRKAQALLAYIFTTGQPHSRDALAALLWPESSQKSARASLRRTLYDLSKRIGEELLIVTSESVAPNPAYGLWLDVQEFKNNVRFGLNATESLDALFEAVALYTDDFLAGFSLPDSPEFDEWQFFQREELRQSFAQVLIELIKELEAQGDYLEAVAYARRWSLLDTLHEPAHRKLMKLYALADQQAAAVRQYHECVRILDEELGIPPEDETTALFETIRARRFAQKERATETGSYQEEESYEDGKKSSLQPVVVHNLPVQTTPFVGRSQEIDEITSRLTDPNCRLLTLIGPGGIGKTRLALEVSKQMSERDGEPLFRDGIYFVALQTVVSHIHIPAAIADALGYQGNEGRPLIEQLQEYLVDKELLLVLDNIEHLPEIIDLIVEIQATSHHIKILVTSRDAVQLQEAWFYPVAGMRYPSIMSERTTQDFEYDALQFFEQCAAQHQMNFSMQEEIDHAIRICRLTEGMPLALELATGWLKILSTEEVAEEIAQSLDVLTSQSRNIPIRHRSVRSIFDYTWQQLDFAEKEMMKRLSVFRGGCLRAAAESVADANLTLLASLSDRALIRRNRKNRYEVHELIRQFAASNLSKDEREQLGERHADYFAQLLSEQEPHVRTEGEEAALSAVADEIENVRAGWQWAMDRIAIQPIDRTAIRIVRNSIPMLTYFYIRISRYPDGLQLLNDALSLFSSSLAGVSTIEQEQQYQPLRTTRAVIEGQLASIYMRLADYDRALDLCTRSIPVLRTQHEDRALADVLTTLGRIQLRKGRYEETYAVACEACEIYTQLDQEPNLTLPLNLLGMMYSNQGNYAQAQEKYDMCLEIFRKYKYRDGIAQILTNSGTTAARRGDFARSISIYLAALEIVEELENEHLMLVTLCNLGSSSRWLGQYEDARSYYTRSLEYSRRHKEGRWIIVALNGLGDTLLKTGALVQAEEALVEALVIATDLGAEPDALNAIAGLGQLLLVEGEVDDAVRYIAFMANHPLSTSPDREQCIELLQEIEADMGTERFTEGVASTRYSTIYEITQLLRQRFLSMSTSPPR